MVRAAVHEYGFVGIKVHRHDARITREICDAARELRVPVLYDIVGEVSVLELLAGESYPRSTSSFRTWEVSPTTGAHSWQSSIIFARHPNIHADTSGVRRFNLLEQAVARAGARKVLFGSDGPWLHPALELAKVRLLGLPPQEEALILGENFLRLIRGVNARDAGWHAGFAALGR